MAATDYAELLREAVRGNLMSKGLLGARIDQLADLAVDALLDHGCVIVSRDDLRWEMWDNDDDVDFTSPEGQAITARLKQASDPDRYEKEHG